MNHRLGPINGRERTKILEWDDRASIEPVNFVSFVCFCSTCIVEQKQTKEAKYDPVGWH